MRKKCTYFCDLCGKSFDKPAQDPKLGLKRAFCSRECSDAAPRPATKHGELMDGTKSSEYGIWTAMKARCLNPNAEGYHLYGGRGIQIDPEWVASFSAFLRDVGRRPGPEYSIDRIDVNGNYEKNNVRWSTPPVQAANRRNNRVLTFNGETLHAAEWARRYGLFPQRLLDRLNSGWTVERALTTPTRKPVP